MLTALRKIYDFAGNWQGVLKKSVAFSLLHSIFDMFQIAALFLILIGLTEGMTLQIIVFTLLLLIIGILGKIYCSYIVGKPQATPHVFQSLLSDRHLPQQAGLPLLQCKDDVQP